MDNRRIYFCKTLREMRQSLEWTQKQVAEKIGITYQSYQAYENGIALPAFENLLKLCDIFDITPNELLGYNC